MVLKQSRNHWKHLTLRFNLLWFELIILKRELIIICLLDGYATRDAPLWGKSCLLTLIWNLQLRRCKQMHWMDLNVDFNYHARIIWRITISYKYYAATSSFVSARLPARYVVRSFMIFLLGEGIRNVPILRLFKFRFTFSQRYYLVFLVSALR